MSDKTTNPNTSGLWDKLLFENNDELFASPFYLAKINWVIQLIKKFKGKFLDIGFGAGFLEKEIIRNVMNLDIYGVDISKKAVSEARQKLKGKFYVANIFKLPFKSNFFDSVSALDILEHVYKKDVLIALDEINRVLKKNGKLIVSVPLNENLERLDSLKKNINRHLREYTFEILQSELELSGFRVTVKKFIYSFATFYNLKSLLTKFLPGYRKPNLLIVYCIKI